MYNNYSFNFVSVISKEVSRLYSLPPVETQKDEIESLTRYISHLAKEHNVSVGVLMKKVIFPYIEGRYLLNRSSKMENRFYDGAKVVRSIDILIHR